MNYISLTLSKGKNNKWPIPKKQGGKLNNINIQKDLVRVKH